jgi:hypothetical protein
MPAKSTAQQGCWRRPIREASDTPKSKLKGPSKNMAESMSEKELDKMASTKREGKPKHGRKT